MKIKGERATVQGRGGFFRSGRKKYPLCTTGKVLPGLFKGIVIVRLVCSLFARSAVVAFIRRALGGWAAGGRIASGSRPGRFVPQTDQIHRLFYFPKPSSIFHGLKDRAVSFDRLFI